MSYADGKLTLTADEFVWKCCIDLDGEKCIADNAFDLFPGIPKVIPWEGDLPVVCGMGNKFANSGK